MPQCPLAFITPEIHRAIDYAGFAKRGTWPVGGGLLDQTQWCLDAFRMIWSEQDQQKARALERRGV